MYVCIIIVEINNGHQPQSIVYRVRFQLIDGGATSQRNGHTVRLKHYNGAMIVHFMQYHFPSQHNNCSFKIVKLISISNYY